MSSSREGSPDWLRCFQAPTHSALVLSSDSESSPDDGPLRKDIIHKDEPCASKTSQFSEPKDQDIVFGNNVDRLPFYKNSKAKMMRKRLKVDSDTRTKKKKVDSHKKRDSITGGNGSDVKVALEETFGKYIEPCVTNPSAWILSSDSESCPDNSSAREDLLHREEAVVHKTYEFPGKGKDEDAVLIDSGVETTFNEASIEKSVKERLEMEECVPMKRSKTNNHRKMKGNGGDVEVAVEENVGKHIEPQVSSSRLPLVLPEKVHLSKALVECEGESIDLSGDMGAVGRIVISDTPSRNHEVFLDLKGTIYKTTIVPSRTFCVVSFGQTEAKIEAIMDDFIQLKPQSNVYEAETMVEGTLEGFSFDSEDEVDKMPKAIVGQPDKNEGTEERRNSKLKGKAEKTSGVVRKRGKTAGGKIPKKVRRKAQVPKKAKTKK